MSFWDDPVFDAPSALEKAIQSEPFNLSAVLNVPELLQEVRAKNAAAISALTAHTADLLCTLQPPAQLWNHPEPDPHTASQVFTYPYLISELVVVSPAIAQALVPSITTLWQILYTWTTAHPPPHLPMFVLKCIKALGIQAPVAAANALRAAAQQHDKSMPAFLTDLYAAEFGTEAATVAAALPIGPGLIADSLIRGVGHGYTPAAEALCAAAEAAHTCPPPATASATPAHASNTWVSTVPSTACSCRASCKDLPPLPGLAAAAQHVAWKPSIAQLLIKQCIAREWDYPCAASTAALLAAHAHGAGAIPGACPSGGCPAIWEQLGAGVPSLCAAIDVACTAAGSRMDDAEGPRVAAAANVLAWAVAWPGLDAELAVQAWQCLNRAAFIFGQHDMIAAAWGRAVQTCAAHTVLALMQRAVEGDVLGTIQRIITASSANKVASVRARARQACVALLAGSLRSEGTQWAELVSHDSTWPDIKAAGKRCAIINSVALGGPVPDARYAGGADSGSLKVDEMPKL